MHEQFWAKTVVTNPIPLITLLKPVSFGLQENGCIFAVAIASAILGFILTPSKKLSNLWPEAS